MLEARSFGFRYYLFNANKGTDQLHGYRSADLCLCFRICIKQVFSCWGFHDIGYADTVLHGVQRRMISVDKFFVFLRLLIFALLLLYVT